MVKDIKKEKKELKKEEEETPEERKTDAEEHVVDIFETKATEIETEALNIHNETVTNMLSAMRNGYRKQLQTMVKDLVSVREEGLSGLLTKTNDVRVEEIENNQKEKIEIQIPLGTKTQSLLLKPLTKYKVFLVAIPIGEVTPTPEAPPAPAPEAPPAPAPAPAPPPV